jgi:dienelactone hydrolase
MNLPFLKTRVERGLAIVGKFEPTTSGNESSNHTTSFIHQLQKRRRLSRFFGSPVIAASGAIRLSRKDSFGNITHSSRFAGGCYGTTDRVLTAVEMMLSAWCAHADTLPEQVTFQSADGRTTLTGYLFAPSHQTERHATVVMMHGRAGAYSANAKGRFDATTLSQRHLAWGKLWAAHGYLALLVDGFGPRGYAQGFARFSYETRPAELNEVTVRPLDAYGALTYLRTRPDVALDRIGLQGWSNGGRATLAAMEARALDRVGKGFRAALAFYPAPVG